MSTKHTAGPWRVSKTDAFSVLGSNGAGVIVRCDRTEDAALVAAAPEMYSALLEILRVAQQHDPATGFYRQLDPYEVGQIALRAVVKARAKHS